MPRDTCIDGFTEPSETDWEIIEGSVSEMVDVSLELYEAEGFEASTLVWVAL
jgi:hypothetical protein